MSVATFKIELSWKEFNISLPMLDAWMRDNIGEPYCGNQAHSGGLELWFTAEPSEQQKSDIADHWASIDEEHECCTSYKSAATLAEERATAASSGKAKLAALGLSAEEIAALVG